MSNNILYESKSLLITKEGGKTFIKQKISTPLADEIIDKITEAKKLGLPASINGYGPNDGLYWKML